MENYQAHEVFYLNEHAPSFPEEARTCNLEKVPFVVMTRKLISYADIQGIVEEKTHLPHAEEHGFDQDKLADAAKRIGLAKKLDACNEYASEVKNRAQEILISREDIASPENIKNQGGLFDVNARNQKIKKSLLELRRLLCHTKIEDVVMEITNLHGPVTKEHDVSSDDSNQCTSWACVSRSILVASKALQILTKERIPNIDAYNRFINDSPNIPAVNSRIHQLTARSVAATAYAITTIGKNVKVGERSNPANWPKNALYNQQKYLSEATQIADAHGVNQDLIDEPMSAVNAAIHELY